MHNYVTYMSNSLSSIADDSSYSSYLHDLLKGDHIQIYHKIR